MTITVREAADLYLQDVSKRCNASTVIHYKKRLASFYRDFGDTPFSDLTAQQIKDHLEQESKWPSDGKNAGQLKAPDTIRSAVVAWEQLQKWLIDNDFLVNPITKKKLPKPPGRKREAIPTKAETKTITERMTPQCRQIYLALRLCGARPGELCKAQISDWDRIEGEIVLTEHKTARKTGKARRIPVGHPSLIAIMTECVGERTAGNIFLRGNGKPFTPPDISGEYRKARIEAGLRKDLVPYLSRHEHATKLYVTLGDIKAVADALGHSNTSTTMRYTRFNLDQAKNNQAKFDDSLE